MTRDNGGALEKCSVKNQPLCIIAAKLRGKKAWSSTLPGGGVLLRLWAVIRALIV